MPHGQYMRGTRLDHVIVFGLLGLAVCIIAFAVNPARMLALRRDERRSDDVRKIMTTVLTLSTTHPDKYDALLKRLSDRSGSKFLLGTGSSCAGAWGRFCSDDAVPDDCLPPEEIFNKPEDAPSDPKHSLFGLFGTGYYLSVSGEMIEVGSCGADTGTVSLKTFANP
ncbi:MAG: hypothetical protein WC802_03455 [Patescibacteria group bacterium]